MRVASLGSGSRGNCLLVEVGPTRVMLDCGFSLIETDQRLSRLGLAADDIDAIVVTHEHDDHVAGVGRFAARSGIPVYLTSGTLAAAARRFRAVDCVCFDPHASFAVGEIRIEPFPVPHDAREPAQFVFGDGARRLGVLTDVGTSTPHIRRMLSGCTGLVLECNYDLTMLRDGPYPPALKGRIASRLGHLCNADAAELLAALDTSRLRLVVAAHLSETNNTPALAKSALAHALGTRADDILTAGQDEGFGWIDLD